ncbi:hypothetical protein X989_5907 [Burkholderia pseudomallei MSHR4378]|nr:hypothetical protein X989_5907 [Burkholderia pseudomallei MSHR4378]
MFALLTKVMPASITPYSVTLDCALAALPSMSAAAPTKFLAFIKDLRGCFRDVSRLDRKSQSAGRANRCESLNYPSGRIKLI